VRFMGHHAGVLLAVLCLTLSGCVTIQMDESVLIPTFETEPAEKEFADMVPAGYNVREHHLERSDGSRTWGISAINDDNSVTVLYLGGNGMSVDRSGERILATYSDLELDVWYFDRRGQGRSTGVGTLDSIMSDVVELYDVVREQVDGPLIVHGLSLGSFEAISLSGDRSLDGLVIEASVTNAEEWERAIRSSAIPWYLRLFIRFHVDDSLRDWDNGQILAGQDAPLLFLVGGQDRQTPPELTKRLYEQSTATPRHHSVIDEAHHGNVMTFPQARQAYQEFLGEIAARPELGWLD